MVCARASVVAGAPPSNSYTYTYTYTETEEGQGRAEEGKSEF